MIYTSALKPALGLVDFITVLLMHFLLVFLSLLSARLSIFPLYFLPYHIQSYRAYVGIKAQLIAEGRPRTSLWQLHREGRRRWGGGGFNALVFIEHIKAAAD